MGLTGERVTFSRGGGRMVGYWVTPSPAAPKSDPCWSEDQRYKMQRLSGWCLLRWRRHRGAKILAWRDL